MSHFNWVRNVYGDLLADECLAIGSSSPGLNSQQILDLARKRIYSKDLERAASKRPVKGFHPPEDYSDCPDDEGEFHLDFDDGILKPAS